MRLTVILLFFLSATLRSSAVERWADEHLTVTNGLELWLDIEMEPIARSYLKNGNSATAFSSGSPVDIWHDASGNKRNLYQPFPPSRPRYIQFTGGASVDFDGTDDFLTATGIGKQLDAVTIFILGAPRSNKGEFRGFLSLNRDGANDYSSGLNIDMANGAKQQFNTLNVEGTGFVGAHNLMTSTVAFKEAHVLTIVAEAGTNVTDLRVDGVPQEQFFRPVYHTAGGEKVSRAKGDHFGFDQITVGARFYSNSTDQPHAQGFFDGEISEVLVYSRILSAKERDLVESYLKSKLVARVTHRTLSLLTTVTNLPPVQMFVPGFTVRELPLELKNVNCVKYREDGKLVALGYDGNIWLLSDSDGDGLEDKAVPFWNKPALRAPIGMALTPPDYAKGRGIFVSSKGKFSLIVDTNRDDVADEEIVIATGWPESFHQVDALGAAVAADGSVYFGIGTVNFADAYVVDKKTGASAYRLDDVRGTIRKISPDLKHIETVCTGIRFPVAIAVNANGDLFCTDQEGATWLPNGNPFDELLHIQPGRHYGFPPRHPKFLPSVIDEPSLFDYGPQHQSTCGLNFNEPVNGGPIFGPERWRGDALVAGESRGKLFRTTLSQTAAGYVARNQLIGCLDRLTIDACVSPNGDLVVTTHSGKPDWGSGPAGAGKLYKISWMDKDVPQPIAIWPATETETCIEFDHPLDFDTVAHWKDEISVVQGQYVSAGDRFESLRPGYQAVQNQLLAPRYSVKLLSTALAADHRLLVVRTEPRVEAAQYAFTLPRPAPRIKPGALPQLPQTDLAHDLTGVLAEWRSSTGAAPITTWLPHLDLTAARDFTRDLAGHKNFWKATTGAGTLKLRAQLDLWQMLRAATQPGSKLDFEYPKESVTLVLKSESPLDVVAPKLTVSRISANEIHVVAEPQKDGWFPIDISLSNSGNHALALDVSWFTAEDSRLRTLPLRRILLPWVVAPRKSADKPERTIPEITGGNWSEGRKLFYSDQLACYKCHTSNKSGGQIGPDLANLVFRDYASVMKDIVEPSAAINPDHAASIVELKDGDTFTGILVSSDDTHSRFGDSSGKIVSVSKANIASVKPSSLSLMPEGLLKGLSTLQIKNLFTFLLIAPPLEPAPIEAKGEPPLRSREEITKLLKSGDKESVAATNPFRILLCSGPKDHGPGEHDYPLWQSRWKKLLGLVANVKVTTTTNWPTSEQFSTSDTVVFFSNNQDWTAARGRDLDQYLARGGGLVYLHYAVDGHADYAELAQRIGLAWGGGASKFRHGALDLKFSEHPIVKGLGTLHLVDESYWNLIGTPSNVRILATGIEESQPQPLIWVREQGQGRVFVSIPGHYTWTFDDPLFRLLILRGICWSGHQPVDRLSEVVEIGARVSP